MRMELRGRETTSAWTMSEMIGVLAVIAVLFLALVYPLARHIDVLVAQQEVANLKSFSDALQKYVVATRVIPDQSTWTSAIASKSGFSPNDVLYNVRQQSHQSSRVFLVDPALQMGLGSAPTGLPYTQASFVTNTPNSPMLPVNPRVMIVSSLGKPLPTAVASGVFTSGHPEYFSALWNAGDGTVPSSGPWTNWPGNPADVIVQRINLSPLFVHLLLGKYDSATTGYYTIDGTDGTTVPTAATSVDGYFIRGTVLTLYTNSSASGLDNKQILTSDTSFVFEQGKWRSTIEGAPIGNGVAGFADLVQQFLEATPNTNSAYWNVTNENAQQVLVVNDMFDYMSNYNVWAYTYNFDKNSGTGKLLYNHLKDDLAPALMSDIQGLYLYSGSGKSYYPGNTNTPCR